MKTSDFTYELPPELIAQQPLGERSASRLLCLGRDDGRVDHRQFRDLPKLLRAGDLLVFNDTRVIPARLHGHKERREQQGLETSGRAPSGTGMAASAGRGGRVELLLERLLPDGRCLAQLRVSKKPRPGDCLLLEGGLRWRVLGREGAFFVLESVTGRLIEELERHGHVPLPPYIRREDEASDRERYQTVYAARPGAVAAPTAGLHFDQPLLEELADRGVRQARVTLHVGAGTFQPVRVENVAEHRMHAEYLEVSEAVCEAVAATRERGGRVVAVGTTVVRSLETAAAAVPAGEDLEPWSGDSRLFIYPGYQFRCIDALITNFHLPESTLLMLVSALAGREAVLAAYREAVRERYRFFSYGDAMLIG